MGITLECKLSKLQKLVDFSLLQRNEINALAVKRLCRTVKNQFAVTVKIKKPNSISNKNLNFKSSKLTLHGCGHNANDVKATCKRKLFARIQIVQFSIEERKFEPI